VSAEPGILPGEVRKKDDRFAGLLGGKSTESGHPEELPGEALLAVPGGSAQSDLELGPGARIANSFFSPILCASVSQVVGPAAARPSQLVTRLPDGAVVVPHHVYSTAAPEVRAADELTSGPDPYKEMQAGFDWSGADAARASTVGRGIRVAVLDSAVAVDHRDLQSVRLVLREGSTETPPAAQHGTLIAGVIGATEGNGFGIAGLAPEAEVLSIPACSPVDGTVTDLCRLYELLQAIDTAWKERAQVMNLALVGPANPLLERSMLRLQELGLLVVAAAGNEGTDTPRYPAAYPSVIAVSSLDEKGDLYGRANRGDWVDVLAPGVDILSAVPGDGFAFATGSSLASAHVAGVLALLKQVSDDPALVRAAFLRPAEPTQGTAAATHRALRVCDAMLRMGYTCSER
jgi:subtilisin family serine protease